MPKYRALTDDGHVPLNSNNIANESGVPGTNVTEALDNLAVFGALVPCPILPPFSTPAPLFAVPGPPGYANHLFLLLVQEPTALPGDPFGPTPVFVDVETRSLEPGATLELRTPNGALGGGTFVLSNIASAPNPNDADLTRFTCDVSGTYGDPTQTSAALDVVNPGGQASFAGWLRSAVYPGV